ncbi:MAG: glycosyltransferase family 1 protein [Bradyrhizobium sp.]|uniref:glycosyltransferase n=1 Tax=Bradyrhizobium sp. TaxID=376 RepID=UPI001207499B|nr:glycosyltransferase [Bradyrhizobium sp.]THD64008.1 MAG: glycosyltransferase family 1 protein [Bradyrhizobium sp.]
MQAAIWAAPDPSASTWAELLSVSPTIIHTSFSTGFPLGAASALGPLFRDRAVHFLVMMSWSLEQPRSSEGLAQKAAAYLIDHPLHTVTFLCNTPREAQLLRANGCTAATINKNCLTDDTVFRPMPNATPVYDAVYNARMSPEKRPELAREVDRLALVYFYNALDGSPAEFHAIHARLRALMPRAHFVNQLTSDGCEWLLGPAINKVYAQSRVGLCLSPIEGAMRASIEYLFAGLSIVSTPSLGGRDYFFDDEFCIIAEPDPRSIREAVDALIARNIPRDYVRSRTLARVELDRRRYIDLVQDLIDRAGGTFQFEGRFWQCTRAQTITRWRSMKEFAETVATAVRDEKPL